MMIMEPYMLNTSRDFIEYGLGYAILGLSASGAILGIALITPIAIRFYKNMRESINSPSSEDTNTLPEYRNGNSRL